MPVTKVEKKKNKTAEPKKSAGLISSVEAFIDYVDEFVERFQGAEMSEIPFHAPQAKSSQGALELEWDTLSSNVAALWRRGALLQVPTEKLQRLAPILTEQMEDGTVLDLIKVGEDIDEGDLDRMQKSVEAITITLCILSTKNMSQQVISEEAISTLCRLVQQIVSKNILVVYDEAGRDKKSKQIKAKDEGESEEEAEEPEKDDGKKEELKKFWKQTEKQLKFLPSKMSGILDKLATYVHRVKPQDRFVNPLLSVCFAILKVDSADMVLLQSAAVNFVAAVFLRVPQSRTSSLKGIIDNVMSKDAAQKKFRHFSVVAENSTTIHIQVTTALILQLLQSVTAIAPTPEDRKSVV